MKKHVPFLYYLLIVFFLLGSLISLSGLIGIFQSWDWLVVFTPTIFPVYGIFKGIVITASWLVAAGLLWREVPWGIAFCGTTAALSAAWFWLDRLVVTQNPLPFNRHVLWLVITVLLLIFVLLSLSLVSPVQKDFQFPHKEVNPQSIQATGEKNDETPSGN